ncbi:hypothetical protein [Mesorhizobium sp. URHB0026]
MTTVAGTISGTGATAAIVGRKIKVKMDFSGTASVDIEEQMPSGAWIKRTTAITADNVSTIDNFSMAAIRLNCTAFTNSVEYSMETGIEG